MKRRKFVVKSIKGFPIILLSPTILTNSCVDGGDKKSDTDKTVIVIGAGISGLAASKKLKDEGFKVIVIEAQDKVGGRLITNRSLGVAFDEGASWIHGINGNPITALAQEAGMNTFETVDENRKSYDAGGLLRTPMSYDEAEEELYAILETLKTNGNINQSFEDVFRSLYPLKYNDRLWKFFLSTYITFDTGDLNNLSSLLYDEGEIFEGEERIATNGYDTIATFLAKDLMILFNERVSSIDYTNSKVKVTHNGNVSEADYVLLTVPLGVLKANTIKFFPILPEFKQTAIQKVGMNCVNKFLLIWDTAFWDDVQYISYTPEIRDKFNYFLNVKKFHPQVNALMTFAYSNYSIFTESNSDQAIINEIMNHLRDIYGPNIPDPVKMLRTKWQSNENSFGSYSYTAVETEMRHFEELAQEIDNKLFFAGEHTEIDYFSTVHGAYLSGIREAEKIIKLM
ncbi:MAG: NAD(P)-binding protein [Saprospiraceae bacterium]|nr:NAD(P)-binding protein [Saprospiraceae bacterium]